MTVGSRYLIRKDEMDDLTPFELDQMVDIVKATTGPRL